MRTSRGREGKEVRAHSDASGMVGEVGDALDVVNQRQ